ncbi:hypothetical protein NPX13_g3840 [Xylaria arbuscula]|uniref:Uncharacterized protein n=1 Tax=Xylaria arbuscula TaxID=114810 RepID=A0A9W8TNX5_9PEZI|nr:hypothetical protein NPX13_g3840 [Xylaria arbuscula]
MLAAGTANVTPQAASSALRGRKEQAQHAEWYRMIGEDQLLLILRKHQPLRKMSLSTTDNSRAGSNEDSSKLETADLAQPGPHPNPKDEATEEWQPSGHEKPSSTRSRS